MQPDTFFEVKSRPVYQPIKKRNPSLQHVFIVAGEMPEDMATTYRHCDNTKRTLILVSDSEKAKKTIAEKASLLSLSATVYVAGDESFIWFVSELLTAKGMLPEQIKLCAPVEQYRTVYCCHCYHFSTGVTHSPATCAGCQRLLAVTDHFSRKSGAYLGYQVNAEDPADIPETQELS